MAKQCLIEKQKRPPKFKVRAYNRCGICGRPRGYIRAVRPVQDLLPRNGAPGVDPRRHQVELVAEPVPLMKGDHRGLDLPPDPPFRGGS